MPSKLGLFAAGFKRLVQAFRGTSSVARVWSPHLTVTLVTTALFGIVAFISHQLSRDA
jgi:hypothetical protein